MWCARRTRCTASPGAMISIIANWRAGTTSGRTIVSRSDRCLHPRGALGRRTRRDAEHRAAACARRCAARRAKPALLRPRRNRAGRRQRQRCGTAAGGERVLVPASTPWVWPTQRTCTRRRGRAGRRYLAAGPTGSARARGLQRPRRVHRQRNSRLRQPHHHQARRQSAFRLCAQSRARWCTKGRMSLGGQVIAHMGIGPHQVAGAVLRDSPQRQAGRSAAVSSPA